MERTPSQGVATPSQPPTPSPSSQPSKRDGAEAELSGRNSPPKKQKYEIPADVPHRDLSTIFFLSNQTFPVALDQFSDPTIQGNGLRPAQYKYDKFREWVEGTLGYSNASAVRVNFLTLDCTVQSMTVSNKDNFITLLSSLWNRVCHPILRNHMSTLEVSEARPNIPITVQPAVQVDEHVQPTPVTLPIPDVRPTPATLPGPDVRPRPATTKPATTPIPDVQSAGQVEESAQTKLKPSIEMDPILIDDSDDNSPNDDPRIPANSPAKLDNQEPLPAAEFLRLVRDATSADDEILIPAETEEPGAKEKLYNFDAKTMKKALLFFNTNVDEEGKCRVKGMKGTLHIWQIYTAYVMFMNPITTGINGLCIGLDVGYGKTRLVLLYLRARSRLFSLKYEAKEEWDQEKPKCHLPKGETGCCPSQHKYMVQCPCSWNQETWGIFRYMADLPALIIGPPSLKETWMNEVAKAYADYDKPVEKQALKYYYLYGDSTPGNDLADPHQKAQIVRETKGCIQKVLNFVSVGEGSAADIFFVSSHMTGKLMKEFENTEKRSQAAFGVVIMDEMQNYKGTDTSTTIPHQTLYKLHDTNIHPVTLFALCGTIVEEGPSFLRAPAIHFRNQWEEFGDNGHKRLKVKSRRLPDVLKPGRHDRISKLYKQLIHAHSVGAATEAETKEKAAEIRKYMTPFVKALRQDEMWRGEVLNPLPDVHNEDIPVEQVKDQGTRNAVKTLISSVQTLIQAELQRQKKDWDRRKAQAQKNGQLFTENEPTVEDVIEEVVVNDGKKGAYLSLSRASTFPYLGVLILSEPQLIHEDMYKSGPSQIIPVRVQTELEKNPGRRHANPEEFQSWDFYPYTGPLEENSPKLKVLDEKIQQVLNDNDPKTRPITDPCKARYILAFVNNTLSASLVYRHLVTNRALCEKIEPILFTSSIDQGRRREIMKEMVQPGKEGGRTKVLIAVTNIAAEGFNLQRVNNIIFLELPVTLTKYHQAVGRAVRTGQQLKVNVTRMYDPGNLLEKNNFRLLTSKQTMSEYIYNVKRARRNA